MFIVKNIFFRTKIIINFIYFYKPILRMILYIDYK